MKSTSGSRTSTGLPSRISNLSLDAAADHLLGRDAVDLLGPRPHELDAAAGDDVGLEAVGAQIGQHFQHRLVDQFGVGPLEPRVPGGREPVLDDLSNSSVVIPAWRRHDDLDQRRLSAGQHGLQVALEKRLERLLVLPFGMLRRQRLDAVEGERELDVDRLLAPQRAVVVEHGDALGDGHEVGAAFLASPARRSSMMAFLAGPSFHDGKRIVRGPGRAPATHRRRNKQRPPASPRTGSAFGSNGHDSTSDCGGIESQRSPGRLEV